MILGFLIIGLVFWFIAAVVVPALMWIGAVIAFIAIIAALILEYRLQKNLEIVPKTIELEKNPR